jgi:hypothetical protein
MSKFKILTFKHLLANNQIAVKGDVIHESKFVDINESLKSGFVEAVKEDKKAKPEKTFKPDKK